jgi:DNA-binding MarR family transcriptional regulator
MMVQRDHLVNTLGAVALVTMDTMRDAVEGVVEGGLSAAAALVTLAANPDIGVTDLGKRIGLSQPGTVRMIDALEKKGLVERRPGKDRRSIALHPTEDGRSLAKTILTRRAEAINALLDDLPTDQMRAGLGEALDHILRSYTAASRGELVDRTCRLCSEADCIRVAPCPVDEAWRAERG